MSKSSKKIIIFIISFVVLLLLVMVSLPFVLHDKIEQAAKEQINQKMTARVDFKDVSLSFFAHFPYATVRCDGLKIVGQGAFKADTLIAAEHVDLVVNLASLLSTTGYEVKKLQFDNIKVMAHVLPDGKANWDIMKPSPEQKKDTTKSNFKLLLKKFEIKNANIVYWDEQGKRKVVIKNFNHTTQGDLTADNTTLTTKSDLESLDFWMGGIKYISSAKAKLDVDIDADLKNSVYKLSKNSSTFNAIPFSLEGWVKGLADGWDMDLKLKTDKVDFKSVLSLVPAIYSKSFEDIKADGKVNMSGFVKGKMVGDFYPAFDLHLQATNGSFQYPNLPQSLQNINVTASITNPGKTLDATVVDISKFSFTMGSHPFSTQLRIATPLSDPDLTFKAVGKIDLGKINEFYPLDDSIHLNGLFDMNVNMAGKMSYYSNNEYEKFIFSGNMSITDMKVKMKSFKQEVAIATANMIFNNQFIDLTTLKLKIGRNDLTMSGKVENFIGYALHDKTIKGQMTMQSDYFNSSDFMSSDDAKKQDEKSQNDSKLSVIVIPKNIDFKLNATFKQLLYSKMHFENAKGELVIVDGDLKFQNMSMQAFGGTMGASAVYSTSTPSKPSFGCDLKMSEVQFAELSKQVESMQKIAPIFEKATGKLNVNVGLKMLLKQDMMPDMNSLNGSGMLSTKQVGLNNVTALTNLQKAVKTANIPTSLNDIVINFEIHDGKIITKPFEMKMGEVKMKLGGTTSFEKVIDYDGVVYLPATMRFQQFSEVKFKIVGPFDKPQVKLDLGGSLKNVLNDAKEKVITQVTKQVEAVKTQVLDEAKLRKEQAIKAAQQQADNIRNTAKQSSDQVLAIAKSQADQLVGKASNPFAKKVAEVSAQKIIAEAQKKSNEILQKGDNEAKAVLQKANDIK